MSRGKRLRQFLGDATNVRRSVACAAPTSLHIANSTMRHSWTRKTHMLDNTDKDPCEEEKMDQIGCMPLSRMTEGRLTTTTTSGCLRSPRNPEHPHERLYPAGDTLSQVKIPSHELLPTVLEDNTVSRSLSEKRQRRAS